MVANGCRAREAWEACGKPNGEKAIQNIRQRGQKRAAEQAQLPEGPEPEPEPVPVKQKKQRKVYQNARQTEQENARKRKREAERKDAFKAATLEVAAAESGQLAGRSILFNWEACGWAVGVLGQPNTNKRYKVEGVVANFRAEYACDGQTASHVLSLTNYASDSGAGTESWVLLGPPEGEQQRLEGPQPSPSAAPASAPSAAPASARKLSKQPLLPSTTPLPARLTDADVDELTSEEVAALMVRLSARMSGASSSSTPP
jgi:hypothetical protein